MLLLLFNFLKNHCLGGIIITSATSIIMIIGVQHLEIGHLHARVDEYKAINKMLVKANEELKLSIDQQNKAVDAWVADSKRRQEKSRLLVEKARKASKHYTNNIKKIQHEPVNSSDCATLTQLIERYVQPLR